MRGILTILAFVVLFAIPLSTNVFAQTSYEVKMPTGSSNSLAPYFWQSVKDGSTTGIVEILVGDTIVWSNADTAFHTVTSGSEADGLDGLFDSKEFAPGKSFTYKFSEIGNYPYYCTLHPWMMGTIIVTSGYSIIPNVGKQVGDGKSYIVEYDFNRLLSTVTIDEEQKSITFEIIGDVKTDNHDLELRLHSGLIDGPFVIWLDGKNLSDFENVREGVHNVLFLQLDADSKILTIVGTSIVPEFGPMVFTILGISVVSMIFLSHRFKSRISF